MYVWDDANGVVEYCCCNATHNSDLAVCVQSRLCNSNQPEGNAE